MNKLKYLILLIIPIILSGCYNYRELNDLAITTAISIDYDKEEENFKVIAQIINPIKEQDATSSGEPSFINYDSTAKTIQEAFRLVILDSPKQLYGSQVQILILGESVLEKHLPDVIDFFTREPELRSEFKVIIAKGEKALDSISIQTLLDNLSSSNILDSLDTQSEKLGLASISTLNEVTNMYLNPYLEIVLPSMTVEGSLAKGESKENLTTTSNNTTTKISTNAVFKDNKFLGYLTEEQSKMLNIIRGDVTDTILSMDIDDGYIVFEPNKLKTSPKVTIKENKVEITIEGLAKIKEVTGLVDLTSPKEIEALQNSLNKYLEELVAVAFEDIRDKYNTDAFKFRDLYYKEDPKYFKENYNDNWYEETFPQLQLEVKSKIKLYEKGNTLGGIEYERENQ